MSRLVVTFDPDASHRGIIQEALGEAVSIDYLPDQPSERRSKTLREAKLLLGWSLSRELEEDEYAVLGDDQVLQTLSAGVDHVPLDRLPDGMTVLSNAGAYADPMAEHVLGHVSGTLQTAGPGGP